MFWKLPEILHWTSQKNSFMMVTDLCQWGTPWKKPTSIWFAFFDKSLVNVGARRCHPRGCVCSRTGKAHIGLSGKAPGGLWRTLIAQAYPKKFASFLASAFLNQLRYNRLRSTHNLGLGGAGQLCD